MLDVRMSCGTHPNGLVMLTNHLQGDDIKDFKTPTHYAQMWMAKYFGIYAREQIGANPGRIYFGSVDMRIDKFCLDDETTDFKFSTLDHHENLDPSIGLQQENVNCGIWMLMEMFNRGDGYERPIGERTQQQLKAYCIRLFHPVIKNCVIF